LLLDIQEKDNAPMVEEVIEEKTLKGKDFDDE
jgi:hypothetical protein